MKENNLKMDNHSKEKENIILKEYEDVIKQSKSTQDSNLKQKIEEGKLNYENKICLSIKDLIEEIKKEASREKNSDLTHSGSEETSEKGEPISQNNLSMKLKDVRQQLVESKKKLNKIDLAHKEEKETLISSLEKKQSDLKDYY